VVTLSDVEQLLALGHETRSFEVKGPGDRGDKGYCAKIARAAMAMGNLRDGGLVCLGIGETQMVSALPGLSPQQVLDWSDFDYVSDALARYCDPPVSFELIPFTLSSGASVVVLDVAEFEIAPYVCRRSYPQELQDGMTYVRPRGKPESVPVPSHGDMRELLDLAITRGVREFIRRAGSAGISLPGTAALQTDKTAFADEAAQAWAVASPELDNINELAHFDVAIRPGPYDDSRISAAKLESVIAENAVRLRGWPMPFVESQSATLRYGAWVGQDTNPQTGSHREAWRLFTSGQFLHRRVLVTDLVFSEELSRQTTGATGTVAVWDVLLYLVEIAEFAARLATTVGSETVALSVTLEGVAGRQLVSGERERDLPGDYVVHADALSVEHVLDSTALIADTRQAGVAVAQGLLRQFGLNLPDGLLLDWQGQILR
jgi:hypothetical protein